MNFQNTKVSMENHNFLIKKAFTFSLHKSNNKVFTRTKNRKETFAEYVENV